MQLWSSPATAILVYVWSLSEVSSLSWLKNLLLLTRLQASLLLLDLPLLVALPLLVGLPLLVQLPLLFSRSGIIMLYQRVLVRLVGGEVSMVYCQSLESLSPMAHMAQVGVVTLDKTVSVRCKSQPTGGRLVQAQLLGTTIRY